MRTLTLENDPLAVTVEFSADAFRVVLDDGRELSVPLAWFPRLLHATPEQRKDWELIGRGEGLHWDELDEDISVAGLLAGPRRSDASLAPGSLKRNKGLRRSVAQPSNDALRNHVRNLVQLTLSAAAKEVGHSKSTLSRAVASGRLSANRCEDGSYQIDPAELYRVFPLPVAQPAASNTTQPDGDPTGTLRMQLETLERERSRERGQMQATIEDLRTRLDRAESRIAALLPAPPVRQRKWRLWGRE